MPNPPACGFACLLCCFVVKHCSSGTPSSVHRKFHRSLFLDPPVRRKDKVDKIPTEGGSSALATLPTPVWLVSAVTNETRSILHTSRQGSGSCQKQGLLASDDSSSKWSHATSFISLLLDLCLMKHKQNVSLLGLLPQMFTATSRPLHKTRESDLKWIMGLTHNG